MGLERFLEIRKQLCSRHSLVSEGKMMRSPAICYKGKVFSFFSTQHKMVFKLGKTFSAVSSHVPLSEFNPFKTKKPLTGWYEVDRKFEVFWEELSLEAFELARENGK